MSEREPAEIVAAGYDAVADRYAALEETDAVWPRARRLRAFVARLPGGAAVLDLGCGSGVPVARELVAAGCAVTGVDVSKEQVRRARAQVPQGDFRVGEMTAVDLPAGAFDAVISLYAIDHVPRELHGEVFRRVRRWLRPGGLALVAIEDDDQPGVVANWLGAPMFFSVHPAAVERRLAEEAGLEVVEAEVEAQREQGRDVRYTWLLLRRPPEA